MSWKAIDFQGVIDLDFKIIEQLERYLQEKETRLANQILSAIPSLPIETSGPILPIGSAPIKLSEAVEGFSKKVRYIKKEGLNKMPPHDGQLVKELNGALWEFTEELEGCVVELFQQVQQVPINRWHVSISQVVQGIKEILIHRIEDLMWTIRRLEQSLKEYSQQFQKNVRGWQFFGKTYLDRDLLRNLEKSERFLKDHYDAFNQHYHEYMDLSLKVEDQLQKMKSYPVLALLEVTDQNLYVDVFRLIKMLELSRNPKKEISVQSVRALKNLASIDHIMKVLRTYYREIKEAFFKTSLDWKSLNHEDDNFKEALEKLKTKTKEYHHELQQLMHIMSRFRTFILQTDPNPYVRSRWGFTEWIVGPEPEKAKKMIDLIYSTEELNAAFNHFIEAVAQDQTSVQTREYSAQQEIDKLLHEMGQPLISRSMMHNRVEKLLNQLKACDEVGSPSYRND